MRKFALDTNLYVRAFRNSEAALEVQRFYAAFVSRTYLSSVVLHELLVGATDAKKARSVDREVAHPFLRRRRLITPPHSAWVAAGEAIAQLAATDGLDRRSLPRSFVNDVLLAASCRDAGVTLVTDNVRDFERIRRVLDFDFTPPWPMAEQVAGDR